MKLCFNCKTEKETCEFHKKSDAKDGLMPICKVCNKKRSLDHFRLNKEKSYISRRLWIDKNKERNNFLKWRWKEKNKENKEYKLKRYCRTAVQGAIKIGRMVREDCECPNCDKIGEAHHWDYSQPLKITWLCKKHHAIANKVYRLISKQ